MSGRRRSRSPEAHRQPDRYRESRDYNQGSYESSRRGSGGGEYRGHGGDRDRGRRGSERDQQVPLQPLPPWQKPENGRVLPDTSFAPQNNNGFPSISVDANHFAVKTLPIVPIYTYDLMITVSDDSIRPHEPKKGEKMNKALASQVARVMMHSRIPELLGSDFVWDGVSQGWSPKKLMEKGEAKSTTLQMGKRRDGAKNNIDFACRCSGRIDLPNFVKALQEGRLATNNPSPEQRAALESVMRWLNALHRHEPAKSMITRPRSNCYFERSPQTAKTLESTGGILEALRGFFATVMIRFGQLCVNVDSSTTPFYVPNLSLIRVAVAFAGVRDAGELNRSHWSVVSSRIQQVYCCAPHLKTDRKLKLKGLSRDQTAFSHSFNHNGVSTTCYDYYTSRYGIKLRFPEFPLVLCRDALYPMEVLVTAPGERYKELLQGKETADFIKFSCAPPPLRRYHVEEALRKLNHSANPLLARHGVAIDTNFMKVAALILPSPAIRYQQPLTQIREKWNLRGVRFYEPRAVKPSLMYVGTRQPDPNVISGFYNAFVAALNTYGMQCPREEPAFLIANPHGDIASSIKQLMQKSREPPTLLLFILQESSTEIYKAIKNCCEVDLGIGCQVMLSEKALSSRGQQQYLGNIALKANVKMGGRNAIYNTMAPSTKRLMFLGADTSHPSPAQMRLPTPPPAIASLVGSYDETCVSYTGVSTAQNPQEQLIENLGPMFRELLRRYREKRNELPTDVIYFRDGLSETQFLALKNTEVNALKEILSSFKLDTPIKLTVIITIKRHHTRFFPRSEFPQFTDEKGNLVAGTAVQNAAQSASKDFFLLSHGSLQGTSRPTHYITLHDEIGIPLNDLYRLIYNGCCSYPSATRAVAIFPAVYFADQLATRSGLWVRENGNALHLPSINDNLIFTMFWL